MEALAAMRRLVEWETAEVFRTFPQHAGDGIARYAQAMERAATKLAFLTQDSTDRSAVDDAIASLLDTLVDDAATRLLDRLTLDPTDDLRAAAARVAWRILKDEARAAVAAG
jgi:hypothetical protein